MNNFNSNTAPLLSLADVTKWLLMCAAASFGAIFAWNIISPISVLLAVIVAASVIGLNFAEGYLVRFTVAAWRFGFNKVAIVSGCGVLLIAGYSIMAGSSVIESYLVKNQQSAQATDFRIKAAQQRISAAREQSINSMDFQNRQADYLNSSAAENEKIAALLLNKPTNNASVNPSTAASVVAVAIEIAIIGLAAFIELFVRPTPLPALVKFNDKLVEWGLNDEQLQGLNITASPSAGTVGLPQHEENRPPRVRTRGEGVEEVQIEMVEDHFQAWTALINEGILKPTVKDTKKYLRVECNQSMEVAQVTAQEYLERAYNMGYLDINDKKGAFASQYVLANQKLIGQGG